MAIDLIKMGNRRDSVINLKKKLNLEDVEAQVIVVMDYSLSMSKLYSNNTVQDTVERLLPIGLGFDVDKSIDVILFHDGVIPIDEAVTLKNVEGYVEKSIQGKKMGGTNYSPVIKHILNKYSKYEKRGLFGLKSVAAKIEKPVYVIFITDGDCNDHLETEDLMKESKKHGVFFQFVGLGDGGFRFLKKLDTLSSGSDSIDNANFFHIEDIRNISDDELYSKLMVEFPGWVKQAKIINLIS